MTRKQRRLYFLIAAMIALGSAVGLVLAAFRDNVTYFYGPSELMARTLEVGSRQIRLGGLVMPGSVIHSPSGAVQFSISDGETIIPVHYRGILPDLFREGQGVIAEGQMEGNGTFIAQTILAKHDETYMPPEVAEALKRAGKWRGNPSPNSAAKP